LLTVPFSAKGLFNFIPDWGCGGDVLAVYWGSFPLNNTGSPAGIGGGGGGGYGDVTAYGGWFSGGAGRQTGGFGGGGAGGGAAGGQGVIFVEYLSLA